MSVALPFYYLSTGRILTRASLLTQRSKKPHNASVKPKRFKDRAGFFTPKKSLNQEISFLTNAMTFYKTQV